MPILGLILSPIGKAGLALALVAALYGWHRVELHRADRAGYARAIVDIERANAAAGRAADVASGRVGDCYRDGGTWNRETGRCDKP